MIASLPFPLCGGEYLVIHVGSERGEGRGRSLRCHVQEYSVRGRTMEALQHTTSIKYLLARGSVVLEECIQKPDGWHAARTAGPITK